MRFHLIQELRGASMKKGEKSQFIKNQLTSLRKIPELHKQLKSIDKSLEKLYPVTIVENDTFFVFDLDSKGENYEFKQEYPTPMKMPSSILAAFALDFYNMKPSAIVTKGAFNNLEGYVFIFHEFVHCYQWEKCEYDIRKVLEIEKIYKSDGNFMWEITHPFPYEDHNFINKTMELDNFDKSKDLNNFIKYHMYMRKHLSSIDFEYMIWQEWKEGYARYIENKIRKEIGLNLNINNLQAPFSRVCFYEIGSSYVDLIINFREEFLINLHELFYKMINCEI